MRTDFWYDSLGGGRIHGCRWTPEGEIKAVVQIVHGITEYMERYDHFADFLAKQGFLVVGEDHMGHGQTAGDGGTEGFFCGGWGAAVGDTYRLLTDTRQEYPDLPYILLGHSMGSFMARSILFLHPDCGITAAVISGTCWQPAFAMPAIVKVMEGVCNRIGETSVSEKLQNLVFGSYNARVEHRRTELDWICRDNRVVDSHPMMQGRRPTAGLLRDMMSGIRDIEQKDNLGNMRKDLPVLFVAGKEDPVGNYGSGVHQAAKAFRKAGMTDVTVKLYPLCRHEILNEINKEEIYADILRWIEKKMKMSN